MPINASYEYLNAEKVYLQAQTLDEKIRALEEMIKTAPKHKSSENLLAELKTRLKKFLEKKEKNKKVGKSSKRGIKKEGYQCVLIGLTNSGKSSLLANLTNAHPIISTNKYTTREPQIGTIYHNGIKIQMIEIPSIGSENFDSGIIHTADCIILVITSLEEIKKIEPYISKSTGKRIIVLNKSDLFSNEQKRKINETFKSKKIPGILISSFTNEGIEELKTLIIKDTGMIRIYTKEPGKQHSPNPLTLKNGSTIKDVAESIRTGFSKQVKEAKITGPSSKFPNQKVGLTHILKDLDIVEFHTR